MDFPTVSFTAETVCIAYRVKNTEKRSNNKVNASQIYITCALRNGCPEAILQYTCAFKIRKILLVPDSYNSLLLRAICVVLSFMNEFV